MKLQSLAAGLALALAMILSCQTPGKAAGTTDGTAKTGGPDTQTASAPAGSTASATTAAATNPTPTKLCALTFDDGPDAIKTARVLDKLDKYGVKATFFWVGQKINDSAKEAIDRIVASGCEVGNHGWSYSAMDKMDADSIKESINDTSDTIKEFTGKEPAFFRPPNLAVSETMYQNIPLIFVEGVLAVDWSGTNTSAKDRANNVLGGMKDGAIILMHDNQPDPHPTPEALDILIPELKKRGYEFVTLSELFARKGIKYDPSVHKMYKYVN